MEECHVDKARNDLSAAVPKFCLALEEYRQRFVLKATNVKAVETKLDRLRKRFAQRQPSYRNRPGFLIPGGVTESGN